LRPCRRIPRTGPSGAACRDDPRGDRSQNRQRLRTASPTADSTAQSTPEPTAPIYVIREAGIAVDLAAQDVETEHPLKLAAELVRALMRNEAFAGN